MSNPKTPRWHPNALLILGIVAFYAICDLAERLHLVGETGPVTLDALHWIRSFGTGLLAAGAVAWNILRRNMSPFKTPDKPFVAMETLPEETEDIRSYCSWFANLRWIAAFGVVTLSLVCCYGVHLLPVESFLPLLLCMVALVVFNSILVTLIPRVRQPYTLLILQSIVDLVVLTVLLHYSGGLENPLFTLYILHVIIASILLDKKDARLVLILSCSLLTVLGLEHAVNPGCHVHLGALPIKILHTPLFALGVAGPYVFILIATWYILRMVRDQLNNTAAQRRIAYEQLIRQEKMVVLGEVAAGVAHEINNPLHGVRSCLSLMKARPEDPALTEEFLPLMEEGMDRIALITRRLLLHSRHEKLPVGPLDLSHVLEESIQFIEYRAREQRTELRRNFAPSLPEIEGDSKTLSEVFINLLVNALDAVGSGGTIEVATREGEDAEGRVVVWIDDTGCGIAPEHLEKIFHPFFTTKPIGKGSGLGLSISKKIVEDHEGTLTVQSTVGKGSRFTMTFPVRATRAGTGKPATDRRKATHERKSAGH